MIRFPENVQKDLIELGNSKHVYLEGNILKVISDTTPEFDAYIEEARNRDDEARKKRLGLTKTVQDRCKELEATTQENERLMDELQDALSLAEKAKEQALNEVSVLQKRTQFELIGDIVKVALFVIVAVGIVVTGMYVLAMTSDSPETTLIGNTWSNLFGILLTNSFSIIGTIMGVKYADDREKRKE